MATTSIHQVCYICSLQNHLMTLVSEYPSHTTNIPGRDKDLFLWSHKSLPSYASTDRARVDKVYIRHSACDCLLILSLVDLTSL